jgi:hypothetical protein
LQRVLAQAKNGDEIFWEEKFHAADGKPQAPSIVGSLHSFIFVELQKKKIERLRHSI